jgi:prolyl-tRNA editing enzyme YbaK/EbsC (Cys-tRNA(Pro) deacylase)
MWPEAVERLAIFLRASGVEGRLEELLPGAERPPGTHVSAAAFECRGGDLVVAVLPLGATLDEDKLAAVAGCADARPAPAPEFPFQGVRVFVDRMLLTAADVWVEAGSARHVLGLAPAQLVRLTAARTADLQAGAGQRGEVDDGPRG